MSKGTVYLLMGNFGVGKTTITNFFPHSPRMTTLPFTEVNGVLSLGGERGADTLNGDGYDKRRVFMEVLPQCINQDILVHSVFFQSLQDINRYTRTHNVEVIYLDTPFQVNAQRVEKRSEGRKQINPKTYASFIKNIEKVRQFCIFKKIKFHKIDNARPIEVVANEVWAILKK